VGGDRPHTQVAPGDVDLQYLLPLRQGDLVERALFDRREDRRVVDQDVDPSPLLDDGVDHLLDGCLVRDVYADGEAEATGVLDLLDDAVCLVDVQIGDHGEGARGRELARQLAPDALSGAGDDDHPPVDAEVSRRRRHTGVVGGVSQGCRHRRSSWLGIREGAQTVEGDEGRRSLPMDNIP
jgi:hypothetical protein